MSLVADASEMSPWAFAPEPEARPPRYRIVSVDDHLVEPPHIFEGRLPARFLERAPRIVETEKGSQAWLLEGELIEQFSERSTAGLIPDGRDWQPERYDQMRRGCWDIAARLQDLDLAGIEATLCFPSKLSGFGGLRYSRMKDQELGLALAQAYNDWHLEEWAGLDPARVIPCQIPWLGDPEVGAAEVRRNAERGFKAITFPENPTRTGFASIHTGHWDPILQACEETGTVVCLHVGSGAYVLQPSDDAPADTRTVLFPANAIMTAIDWLYSMRPVRFPGLKLMLAEGGLGWVPMMLDRLAFCVDQNHMSYRGSWNAAESPGEVLLRNFWFASLHDPAGFALRDRIGIENIVVESDYPHPDSTWPDTQSVLDETCSDMTPAEIDAITHLNAAALFRHQLR